MREIPRTIHQVWIGGAPMPEKLMASWRDKHPGWEHRLWTDPSDALFSRVARQIEAAQEWCGKADIMRYVILAKYGGVYVDADSECLRPIDALFLERPAVNDGGLAVYEHELVRPHIVANGFIALPPESEVARFCVESIATFVPERVRIMNAQMSTGGMLLTEAWCGAPALPSRTFYPVHWTGAPAPGDEPPYARQLWGSTVGRYPDGVRKTSALQEDLQRKIALVERALGLVPSPQQPV